ncbi:MAG: NUDIX hydrolase [Victivallaceae bacterium]|nr:NUDIX hydrolase [Victivallaceae bacterium]
MSYISKIRSRMGHECVFNPGVRAVILNEKGEVLLQCRTDTGRWGLPAGGVELGETALDALKREVFEETGLQILDAEPLALYSGPEQRFKYPNGDEVQCFAVSFIVRKWSGVPRADGDEGSELCFRPLDDLPDNLVEIHVRVLDDFRRYDGRFIAG